MKFEIGDLVSHHDGRGVGMVLYKGIKIKVKWFETPYICTKQWYFPAFLRHKR